MLKPPAAEARRAGMRLWTGWAWPIAATPIRRSFPAARSSAWRSPGRWPWSPRGLLCDEITSALDPELKSEVLAVLEDLKRDGLTLIVVTHEIGFARRAADRVVMLAEGRVIEDGPPRQVFENPLSARTRQFLNQVLI